MAVQNWLSPRQFAEAIGSSESSVKRWADEGKFQVKRTAGGHRRIARSEAIRFVRREGIPLKWPGLLGLPENLSLDKSSVEFSSRLYAALLGGDAPQATALVVSSYLRGASLTELFDGPLRSAFHKIGELWKDSQDGIWVEHRATSICLQILARIRSFLNEPSEGGAFAVGGAGPGDPYLIPTTMAGLILREMGFHELNLGADVPLGSLIRAARKNRARLVWLSVSSPVNRERLRAELPGLLDRLAETGAHLVLGGRESGPVVRDHPRLLHAQSMSELAAFARGLVAEASQAGGKS